MNVTANMVGDYRLNWSDSSLDTCFSFSPRRFLFFVAAKLNLYLASSGPDLQVDQTAHYVWLRKVMAAELKMILVSVLMGL